MSTQPIMKKYYYKNNELTESNIELAINCFFELYNIKLEYNDRSDFCVALNVVVLTLNQYLKTTE